MYFYTHFTSKIAASTRRPHPHWSHNASHNEVPRVPSHFLPVVLLILPISSQKWPKGLIFPSSNFLSVRILAQKCRYISNGSRSMKPVRPSMAAVYGSRFFITYYDRTATGGGGILANFPIIRIANWTGLLNKKKKTETQKCFQFLQNIHCNILLFPRKPFMTLI